jgi:hypothetical protein
VLRLTRENAQTRLDVVKSLQKLYENDEYISNLRHFTERFQSRFLEMATSDADRSVRVATITLLETVRQRDLLEPEDTDKLALMIFDPEGRIRRAVAATFLAGVEGRYEEICEGVGGSVEGVEEELGDDRESGEGVPFTWLKFNALVKTLVKYDALVDEAEKEDGEPEPAPLKGFELGEVEGRIPMAASSIISEMEELQVLSFLEMADVRTGIIWRRIYCEITRYDLTNGVKAGVFSPKHAMHAPSKPPKKSSSSKSSTPPSKPVETMKTNTKTQKAKNGNAYPPPK